MRPHRWQPTRLPHPWDSPGKNTGVGCHFLLQCMKVKSESEVTQSCATISDPMDCSLPGSSVHGIFQARVLEWGAIAFSLETVKCNTKCVPSWSPGIYMLFFFNWGPCIASLPGHTVCICRHLLFIKELRQSCLYIIFSLSENKNHWSSQAFLSPLGSGNAEWYIYKNKFSLIIYDQNIINIGRSETDPSPHHLLEQLWKYYMKFVTNIMDYLANDHVLFCKIKIYYLFLSIV